jgi:hypothetical protein
MSSEKYPVGTRVTCCDIDGYVVTNVKLPGDICIEWETGMFSSYDEEWLDENVITYHQPA